MNVLSKIERDAIFSLHSKGKSIREISHDMGIARNTIGAFLGKYHVVSGEVRMQVSADSVEEAFVKVLKVVPLDKCNRFIACYRHGGSLEDDETMWGLVELYLKEAGYTHIGDHLWKKNNLEDLVKDDLSLVGIDGLNHQKEKSTRILKHSQRENILQTDFTKHLKQGRRQQKKLSKAEDLSKQEMELKHPVKKVDMSHRTSEEWDKLVAKARKR